jgi:hypothetical protein
MYFDKFPKIQYGNEIAINIVSRVKINANVRKQTSAFLPYEIEFNQTPDNLAFDYYDDPYYDWLVMFSNEIIDPYYDWYLNDTVFQEFIVAKYGSYVDAVETIDHYVRNATDEEDPYDDIVTNTDTQVIDPDAVEYTEKTAYDMESELNESHRAISLINKELRFQAVQDLERLLNDRS